MHRANNGARPGVQERAKSKVDAWNTLLRTHLASYISSISASTSTSTSRLTSASTSVPSSPSTDTQTHTIPNPNIKIFLFSLHHTLNQILDLDLNDPAAFRKGFTPDDVTDIGRIWTDDLHLTADVHEIIADHIVEALFGEGSSPSPSSSLNLTGASKVSVGK
jgi:phospholipase/lecithinase/hemolysin